MADRLPTRPKALEAGIVANYNTSRTSAESHAKMEGAERGGYMFDRDVNISKYNADLNDEKELQFLSKIEDVSDDYIYKMIKKFMGRKLHLKGYGFDYLFTMINSESHDKEKSKKNERKMIGSNPPIKKVKE